MVLPLLEQGVTDQFILGDGDAGHRAAGDSGKAQRRLFKKKRAGAVLTRDEVKSIKAGRKKLRKEMRERTLDPFRRKLLTQDGRLINDGSRRLSPDELLRMDWLCHNITGSIPTFDEILPMSRSIVRELGIYKDQIPAIKETVL